MKTKLKCLINSLSQPKAQRLLLIFAPLLTLLICACILLPQLSALKAHMDERSVPEPSPAILLPSPEPTPVVTPPPTAAELRAASSVGDMLVHVLDEQGRRIEGRNFEIIICTPDGEEQSYISADDGSCYIIGLTPGTHSISLRDGQGYSADNILCVVRSHVEYAQISPESGLLRVTPNNWSLGQSKDVAEQQILQGRSAAPYGWSVEDGGTYFYDNSGSVVTGLASIDGKLYFFNEFGQKAKSFGIDISYYNGNIDWALLKEQGIEFVMVRMGGRGWTSGLVYSDASARDFILGAKAAGLDVGVYFYSTAVSPAEAVSEAEIIINRLKGTELEYPIYLDLEYSGQFPSGRADRLSREQRTEIIKAFCKTVQDSGYEAGIYAGQYYIDTALDYDRVSDYSIWIANYSENYNLPSFHGEYDIWQFTDRGQINGIVGPVDLNVIF